MNWFLGATTEPGALSSNQVDQVLQRIANSTLLEDRQEAVQKLSEYASQDELCIQFNEDSVKIIFEQLQKDTSDENMTKQLLFTVIELCRRNREFIKYLLKKELIKVIVTLLEINNDYVKYHSVQLLTLLLKEDVDLVQQGIILQPIGVSKLVELLGHHEEIIRNECLLLMHALTFGGHQEIQKIIAFEGAFEKLFSCIIEEGGNRGGIIVQDCLNIIKNLVFDNFSNQKYFREIGCFDYLKVLLRCDFSEITPKIQNLVLRGLEILSFLIVGEEASLSKNIVAKTGIFTQVVEFSLSNRFSNEVSIPSLTILKNLLEKHPASQESFLSHNFVDGDDYQSAVVSLCKVVLYDQDQSKQQKAWLVLNAYLQSNTEGQLFIASTIKSPTLISSTAEAGMLCGITIAEALFNTSSPKKNNLEGFIAAKIFSCILRQNTKCKEILLEIPYEVRRGSPSIAFFDCFVALLIRLIKEKKTSEDIVLGLMRLLVEWISSSPETCRRFLDTSENFLFFVEIASHESKSIDIQGLSMLLIGLLGMGFHDKGAPGKFSRETLLEAIQTKFTLTKIQEKLNLFMSQSSHFRASENEKSPQLTSIYDRDFTSFVKETLESFTQYYSGLDVLLNEVKNKSETLKNLKNERISLEESRQESNALIQELQTQNASLTDKLTSQTREHSIILTKMKQSETEMHSQIQMLTDRIKGTESQKEISDNLNKTTIHELEEKLVLAHKEIESLQDSVRSGAILQEQTEEALHSKTQEIKILKSQLDSSSTMVQVVSDLKAELSTNLEKIDLLQKEMEGKIHENAGLSETITTHRAELKEKSFMFVELETRLSTLKQDHRRQIDAIEEKHLLELQNADLVDKNKGEENESVEGGAFEAQLLQDMQAELQKEVERGKESEKELSSLRLEIEKQSKMVKDLEHDNEDMIDIIEKLEEKLKSYQN